MSLRYVTRQIRRSAPSVDQGRWDEVLPDPEAELEQHQHLPAQHLHVAGIGWDERPHALPPSQHVLLTGENSCFTRTWDLSDSLLIHQTFLLHILHTFKVTATDVINSVRNNRDKDRSPNSMLLFGFGDGGGGPNAEMLEKLRRFAGASSLAPAPRAMGQTSRAAVATGHSRDGGGGGGGGGAAGELPSVTIGGPTEFFKDLEAKSRDLLTWLVESFSRLSVDG